MIREDAHAHVADKVQAEAQANALSITREDGLDWLRTMLKRRASYNGPVPVWTKRALRDLRTERDWSNAELAAWLGVPGRVGRVASWLNSTAL